MAHFAKMDENNTVIRVYVVSNSIITDSNGNEQESLGQEFLRKLYKNNNIYLKCSYNTKGGKYYSPNDGITDGTKLDPDQSKAFRGWYPSIGFTYDSINNRFIPAKVFENSKFNEEYLIWEPLIDYPSITTYGDGTSEYIIEFNYQQNKYIGTDELLNKFEWVPETSSWVSTAN
jgi:hypothetical protein